MTRATKELNEIIRSASLEPAEQPERRQHLIVAVQREPLRRPRAADLRPRSGAVITKINGAAAQS
jgi:hypothetical protein